MAIYKPKIALSNKSFSLPWEGMTSVHTLVSDFRTKSFISNNLPHDVSERGKLRQSLTAQWQHLECSLKSYSCSLFGLNLSNLATHVSCAWGEREALFTKAHKWQLSYLIWGRWEAGLVEGSFAEGRQSLPCVALQINNLLKVSWVWIGDGATGTLRICFT